MDANLVLVLGCGAVGGIVAGRVLGRFSLGTLGNGVAGILGAGLGNRLLREFGGIGGGGQAGDIVRMLAAAIVGAAILLVIIGMIRSVTKR